MIQDDILPIPAHLDTLKGIYNLHDNQKLDNGGKFKSTPVNPRAAHCQTVKEYELYKFSSDYSSFTGGVNQAFDFE